MEELGGRWNLPGLCYDNVVEGLMALAKAGQADADNHCRWVIKAARSYATLLAVV